MTCNKHLFIVLGFNACLTSMIAALLLVISNPWVAGIIVAINACGILVNTHTAFVIGRTMGREELMQLMRAHRGLD